MGWDEPAPPPAAAAAESPLAGARRRGEQRRQRGGLPAYAFSGSMISLLMGYDCGVVGAALSSVQLYFKANDAELSWLVGAFSLAEVVGAPMSSIVSDGWGRRPALLYATFVAALGAVIMSLAPDFNTLLIGRLISGLGVGAGGTQASVYLSEIAPLKQRGFTVTQIEIWFNVGIFSGFFLSLLLSSFDRPMDFRIMFGVGGLAAVLMMPLLGQLPESPRWLLKQNREAHAMETLVEYTTEEEARRTLAEFKEESRQASGTWRDLMGPEAWHSVIITIVFTTVVTFCGIDAITYFSNRLFMAGGVELESDRRKALVLMATVKVLMIIVATVTMDKVNRIWIMTVSFGAILVSGCGLLIPGVEFASPMLTTAGILCFAGSFSAGIGPCFYLLSAEIWPTHLRSVGSGFFHGCRGLLASICISSYLTTIDRYGFPVVLTASMGVCFAGLLFVRRALPETQGRSLEEIGLTHRTMARKSLERRTSFEIAAAVASGAAWGTGNEELPPAAG